MPKTALRTKYWLYNKGEASYGAGVSDNPIKIALTNGNFIQEENEVVDNANQMTGSDLPNDARVVGKKGMLSGEILWMRPTELALFFAATLGKVVTTTPTGATTARQHLITPQDDDPKMTSFSQAMEFYKGKRSKYDGAYMDSFSIQGSASQADRDLHGSISIMSEQEQNLAGEPAGGFVTDSSQLSLVNAGLYLSTSLVDAVSDFPSVAKQSGDLTTPVNITTDINDFSLGVSNNSLNPFRAGKADPSRALKGVRGIDLGLNFEEDSGFDLIGAARAGTHYSFQLSCELGIIETGKAAKYGCSIILPKIQPVMVPRSEGDGIINQEPEWRVLEPNKANVPYIVVHVWDKTDELFDTT